MRRWQIDPVRGTVMVGALSGLLAPVVFGVATLSGLASSSGAEILFQAVMQGGVGGVLPVATLMGVVRLLGAATAAILLSLAPVAALALAIPVLGDWPDPTEFLGVAIVIAGLALAHSPLARSRVAPPMGD
ncbi:MAG: EamA family transporter, partial [Pseudomonadota bacterium]